MPEHYSPGMAPFSTQEPNPDSSELGQAAWLFGTAILRVALALGIAIGQTGKRGGGEEQGQGSQNQHQSFHGNAPLRRNWYRDTLQATEGFCAFTSIPMSFRKS